MNELLWKIPETVWVRCPRCGARRGRPCVSKGGGVCPVTHHARTKRLVAMLSRWWCRGCRRRGNPSVETISAYPCDADHLHFYCARCLDFGAEHHFISLAGDDPPRIGCVARDHTAFRLQIDAEMAMRSLRIPE